MSPQNEITLILDRAQCLKIWQLDAGSAATAGDPTGDPGLAARARRLRAAKLSSRLLPGITILIFTLIALGTDGLEPLIALLIPVLLILGACALLTRRCRTTLNYQSDDFGRQYWDDFTAALTDLDDNAVLRVTLKRQRVEHPHCGRLKEHDREKAHTSFSAISDFVTNVEYFRINVDFWKNIIFLPDCLYIADGICQSCCIPYRDLKFQFSETIRRFPLGEVSDDMEVVGKTWEHVTREGNIDRNYRHNREIRQCRLGLIELRHREFTLQLELSHKDSKEKLSLFCARLSSRAD